MENGNWKVLCKLFFNFTWFLSFNNYFHNNKSRGLFLENYVTLQLKELEDEWAKLDSTPPTPTRFTRSQQAKMAAAPPPDTSGGDSGEGNGSGGTYLIDCWRISHVTSR